jgi:hypothetical protein
LQDGLILITDQADTPTSKFDGASLHRHICPLPSGARSPIPAPLLNLHAGASGGIRGAHR